MSISYYDIVCSLFVALLSVLVWGLHTSRAPHIPIQRGVFFWRYMIAFCLSFLQREKSALPYRNLLPHSTLGRMLTTYMAFWSCLFGIITFGPTPVCLHGHNISSTNMIAHSSTHFVFFFILFITQGIDSICIRCTHYT